MLRWLERLSLLPPYSRRLTPSDLRHTLPLYPRLTPLPPPPLPPPRAAQLNVAKVTGGAASKVAKIKQTRRNVARILTAINIKAHKNFRSEVKDLPTYKVPKQLRAKKTRAIRRALPTKYTGKVRLFCALLVFAPARCQRAHPAHSPPTAPFYTFCSRATPRPSQSSTARKRPSSSSSARATPSPPTLRSRRKRRGAPPAPWSCVIPRCVMRLFCPPPAAPRFSHFSLLALVTAR